ncbi:META domain-containing protein, partial [Turicimonas muris]
MRKFLLGAILLSMTGLASAVTVEDLTSTSSWMPATDSVPSCDIPATITFKKNGKLNSEPGCNSLFGDYVIGDNDKLEFVNMGMTRKLCAKQYM